MEIHPPRRLSAPLALAAFGTLLAALAVVDKVVGLVQHPLHLATLAYVSLFIFLVWACTRGIRFPSTRWVRPSGYAVILILNVLTAIYVIAWRIGSDPTPLLLQNQLARGDALLAAGDKDAAHLLYRAAYRRFPSSFAVLSRMGAVNYQVRDYERAERFFSQALKVAPPDSRWKAWNDLGQTYWKLHRPGDAIRAYEEARKAGIPEAERHEWHYRAAWAYFDAGDYDAAIQHYEIVALRGEKYAAASYYNIACALTQKLREARSPEERAALGRRAVSNLRSALQAAASTDEEHALRQGLIGTPEEQDPELQPLRKLPEFVAFVRDIAR
jgi:tetratricopeptide (TPR) repeat protein